MRASLTLAFVILATPALAETPPLGAGYGAIDAERDTDPVTLAETFCAARIGGDMAPLARYFAPKLARLLDQHSTMPAAVPWQSYTDRPDECAIEVLNGFDDTVGVLVKITYSAPGGRSWSDTLNLERTPDSWMINNVFYQDGGNLRFKLFERLGT